jgi:hypothetical protein
MGMDGRRSLEAISKPHIAPICHSEGREDSRISKRLGSFTSLKMTEKVGFAITCKQFLLKKKADQPRMDLRLTLNHEKSFYALYSRHSLYHSSFDFEPWTLNFELFKPGAAPLASAAAGR